MKTKKPKELQKMKADISKIKHELKELRGFVVWKSSYGGYIG